LNFYIFFIPFLGFHILFISFHKYSYFFPLFLFPNISFKKNYKISNFIKKVIYYLCFIFDLSLMRNILFPLI